VTRRRPCGDYLDPGMCIAVVGWCGRSWYQLRHPGNNRPDRGEGFPSGHPCKKVVLFTVAWDTSNIWARSPANSSTELRFKTSQINDILKVTRAAGPGWPGR